MHFGATLRMLRTDSGVSLRALAERIGVSSAYLSRVENGHDAPPTPDRLVAIAEALGVAPALLVELGDKVSPFVAGYLSRTPAANALFLEIARRELTPVQLAHVQAFLDERFPPKPKAAAAAAASSSPRLGPLLARSAVVLQLACADLDDMLDVAATRLAENAGVPAASIARALREREREGTTAIGAGIVAPHAIVAGAESPALAVMVLRRPLAIDAPDARPIRVCIAVVHPRGGRELVALLAQIARLSRDDVADQLLAAREPRRVLSVLEALRA
jgi:PTS system nitrogen regulatory IIA component